MVFDFRSGGLSCRHFKHFIAEGPSRERRYFTEENGGFTGHQLELECQRILRSHGYLSVLEEDNVPDIHGIVLTSLDMQLNRGRADIRSITVHVENTIKNAIKAKNHQLGKFNYQHNAHHDTLILHYHDLALWDFDKITEALRIVPNQVSRFNIRRIVCTINLNKTGNLNNSSIDLRTEILKLSSPSLSVNILKLNRLLHKKNHPETKGNILVESHIANTSTHQRDTSTRYRSAVVVVYLT